MTLVAVVSPADVRAQPESSTRPAVFPAAPAGFEIDAREAYRIAREDPNVAEVSAERGTLEPRLEAKPPEKWQVGFFAGDEEVVQVHVDSQTGEIRESWTGDQVAWQMARGYPEQFGHALNSPFVRATTRSLSRSRSSARCSMSFQRA